MTPRKLTALAAVHGELKSGKAGNSKPDKPVISEGPWKGSKVGYVDQIF